LNITSLQRIARYPAPIRILTFLLALVLGWSPFALGIYVYFSSTKNLQDPEVTNLLNILVMGGLGVFFLLVLPIWSRLVYDRPHIFRYLGLIGSRQNGWGLLQGWLHGFLATALLFYLQSLLGWLEWQPAQRPWSEIISGGLLSSFGVALGEELFFRGWLLAELESDYRPQTAMWSNGLIFAILHFLKPLAAMLSQLPQFPGLWLMGMVLVVAKRSQDQLLGISIGLHAGMIGVIYLVDVGQIVKYNNRAANWITGGGMPTAGLMGIIGLAILFGYFTWCWQRLTDEHQHQIARLK
jgi:uncharacterized protein